MDYKISTIKRYDNVTEVLVRVYEGAVTTENEEVTNPKTKKLESMPVTRYRRTKVLGELNIKYRGDIAPTREERDIYLRRMIDEKVQAIATTEGKELITEQQGKEAYLPVNIEKEDYVSKLTTREI